MRRRLAFYLMLFFILINTAYIAEASTQKIVNYGDKRDLYRITMKQDLLCLMMAYPGNITDVACSENGNVYIVMKSGKKIIYDDKRVKNFEQKLINPDLQDMMEQVYPLTPVSKLMDKNFDPGRCRVYDLLTEVYGGSRQRIESKLTNVNFGYGSVQFNSSNNAANSLKTVMSELKPAAQRNPQIWGYIFPTNGTFNYRVIAGTNRLSPHSFGIAIDLKRDKRDYWQWASPEEGEKRLLSYPKEVVEIFEKNNFVWGGKWGHFDTLHFEYRPEIIIKGRYFGNQENNKQSWYEGAPFEDVNVKAYIEKIEKAVLLY